MTSLTPYFRVDRQHKCIMSIIIEVNEIFFLKLFKGKCYIPHKKGRKYEKRRR